MNSEGSSRKRAKNPGVEAYSDASNDAPLEVSTIKCTLSVSKSPPSAEKRVLDGLGTTSNIEENEASNEASTIAVAGTTGDKRAAGVELVATFNGRLRKKGRENYCLENKRSKKVLLVTCIGLKIDNEDFDFDKI